MHTQRNPAIPLTSRILGTSLCCVLAVGACFADSQTLDVVREEAAHTETSHQDAAAVTELSVAPLDHKIYPDDRPEWISAEPILDGERHRWPVVSLPSLTEEASQESLKLQMQIAVEAYINHITGSNGKAGRVVHFDDDEIAARLVSPRRRYSGVVSISGGEMYEVAVELEFDEAFREDIREQWRRSEIGQRLTGLGVLGAGGLALLLGLTSILKVFNRGSKVR